VPLELTITAETPPSGVAFDRIAAQYDDIFTHSAIGRAQRELVHRELSPVFTRGSRILDLNCGTGEDALHLAFQGIEVVACDASPAMIDVCRRKLTTADPTLAATFLVCPNEHLDRLADLAPFDGALSNFGGLNCMADLTAVRREMEALVRPGASFFVCLIGRVCAWEIAWYALSGRLKKALRRLRPSGSTATIGGLSFRVHYPSVRQVATAFAPSFRLRAWRGIGIALPPSWLEPHFFNRPQTLRCLQWLDRRIGAWPIFRGIADHVLLHFVREEE
jgi:ubiquinone/menaquinone biosynthesis C-methylase UbiE